MTPEQFIDKWKAADLNERAAAQSHFNDLCALLDELKPTDADPKDAATVVLRRDAATVVIKQVPARVCQNCGEEYVDEAVAARPLEAAEAAVRAGVQVEIRDYVAA